jgi:hypothetical protein
MMAKNIKLNILLSSYEIRLTIDIFILFPELTTNFTQTFICILKIFTPSFFKALKTFFSTILY